jgi:hypothetical protein
LSEEQLVERGAPNWINCELCKCQGTHWQARFVIAEDETVGRASPELPELVLLCSDCSAVAEGAIEASEWKRRKSSGRTVTGTPASWVTVKREDPVFDSEDPSISKADHSKTVTSERPLGGGWTG